MRRRRTFLGTFVDIAILGAPGGMSVDLVADAIDSAFQAVRKVQHLMSFHDCASELSTINAAAPGTVVTVDPWTADVLRLAQDLNDATDGAFDCGIGDVLVAQGELPAPGRRAQVADSTPGTIRDLELVDDRHAVIRRPVCLDLGGIAKGYAVDMAISALVDRGVTGAVVNAGGDLRVLGADPQPIHVRSAGATPVLRYLGTLADGAVATSVTGTTPGKCRGALIDPRSRRRLQGERSFTVLAPTCAVADGLTKAFAVSGGLDAACLRRYGAVSIDP